MHNGLYLKSYDIKAIEAMTINSVKAGRRYVEFKCASKAVLQEASDKLFKTGSDVWRIVKAAGSVDKTIGSGCTYSCDKKLFVIRVDFKRK